MLTFKLSVHDSPSPGQCMVPLFLLCRVNHEVHDLVSIQFTQYSKLKS
jgi:hypothetical protein